MHNHKITAPAPTSAATSVQSGNPTAGRRRFRNSSSKYSSPSNSSNKESLKRDSGHSGHSVHSGHSAQSAQSVHSSQSNQSAQSAHSITETRGEEQSITFNSNGQRKTIQYTAERIIGNGSFGVVFLSKMADTGEAVAIKKVLQDRRYKNRELEIMKTVKHPNVVDMKHYFFTTQGARKDLYLHLVLEYIPDTLHRYTTTYTKQNDFMPLIYVKLFTYQMLRALNYIHSIDICHRDIKPQNLLMDPVSGVLKICDFGLSRGIDFETENPMMSTPYVATRWYRAPGKSQQHNNIGN